MQSKRRCGSGGLERIAREREVLRTVDFSATPIYPGSMREKAWQPFEWIVSDFALVDAIESGLVKIPRIPTDDNAGRRFPSTGTSGSTSRAACRSEAMTQTPSTIHSLTISVRSTAR